MFIYSLGAIGLTLSYQVVMMLKSKREIGRYWSADNSNLVERGVDSKLSIKWINVVGLLLRTFVNFLY